MTEKEAIEIADSISKDNAYPFILDIHYNGGYASALRSGMSRRQLFSSMFLQGIINSGSNVHAIESNCKLAVKYADALLKKLEDGEKD